MDNQTTDNTLQKETKTSVKSKSKANIFCGLSLGLFLVAAFSVAGGFLTAPGANDEKLHELFIFLCLSGIAAYEASLAIAVIARIYFNDSKFAKVVLWIHILVAIAVFVGFIGFCAYCVSRCGGIPG